jgi:DNA-binding response OmpR family regulator
VRQRPAEPPIASQPRTIVLVEDEFLIRLALAEELSEAGFLVLAAHDASRGLELLQRSMPVDLLITDIRMPGLMDGLALARYARATWPQLKIIVISGNLADLPANAADAADAMIEKPFVPDTVLARVKQLLTAPTAHIPLKEGM